MSTLRKIGSPSQEKEKASRLLQRTEEKSTLTFNIPYVLKKRLKTAALSNNTTVTNILLSYAEKYVKTAEQKEEE